jgi:hypothetical protein
MLSKRKYFVLIISFLILSSGILLFIISGRKKFSDGNLVIRQIPLASENEFQHFIYDSEAPDFTLSTFDGQEIKLSDWKGKVIILQFSKFYLRDLPRMLYLDYLAMKFQKDLRLVFINILGKHDSDAINKIIHLSSPVIEDKGYLSGIFYLKGNGIIIIGRDFKIKFSNFYADKRTIHNLVLRYMNRDSKPSSSISEKQLADLIKKVSFTSWETGATRILGELIKDKNAIINLSVSPCMTCPETKRVYVLKDMSTNIKSQESLILFLFARGNSFESLNDYLLRMELFNYPITVGIINERTLLTEKEYLKMFQLDIDPRILILNKKGKIVFLEKLENTKRILESDFFIKML